MFKKFSYIRYALILFFRSTC